MDNKQHAIVAYEEYTRSYAVRYVIEVRHLGLEKIRVLKDLDKFILQTKVRSVLKVWDEQWERQESRRIKASYRDYNSVEASDRTQEAQQAQEDLANILLHTLSVDDTINWRNLKDQTKFRDANPKRLLERELKAISAPTLRAQLKHPDAIDPQGFEPNLVFMDKLFKSKKRKKIAEASQAFQYAYSLWNVACEEIDTQNKEIELANAAQVKAYEEEVQQLKQKFDKLELVWKKDEADFYTAQAANNLKVDELKEKYMSKDEQSVLHYCEMVLNNSHYPEYFPKDFQLDYNSETGLMLVEYILPTLEKIPTLKEVKYIATRNELKETYISDTAVAKIYDEVIYKIVLRSLHELFESDKAGAIQAVVFNGWVDSIDKSTGKLIHSCIVSVMAEKAQFEEINLAQVDPKICFKSFKGVGSSKLSGIVAIQPILQMDKNDKRFVDSYSVVEAAAGENLATMSWEDFEHLIREVFEQEFSSNGGEVKVTQASRDGGVDAIAFDPDPIRGGKIVIQAKRYTNTVGVAAVRDLFGTVINEGATKGILVTTADYGPDAYAFAQNKPITLLSGSHLLHLLEKHGHSCRIDLKEAKLIQKAGL